MCLDATNPRNVAGGLKATINNPKTSQSAKESAEERLSGMQNELGAQDAADSGTKNTGNVLGQLQSGYEPRPSLTDLLSQEDTRPLSTVCPPFLNLGSRLLTTHDRSQGVARCQGTCSGCS